MKLAIITYGLKPENVTLMPWRYVLEIAKGVAGRGNHVVVISDGAGNISRVLSGGVEIIQINGDFSEKNARFKDIKHSLKIDVVVYPIARRSVISRKLIHIGDAAYIGYFPGAWHDRQSILSVLRHLRPRDAIMYGLESLVPAQCLAKTLKAARVEAIICITDFTARKLVASGWDRSRLAIVPPGIDSQGKDSVQAETFLKWQPILTQKRYFLFMGPPKAIRGIHILLKAFDSSAEDGNASLVCLVRGGMAGEMQKLERTLARLKHRNRVHIVKDQLTTADITGFIKLCHAVVLPFLLVPSEIPLAVLETLAQGKPVLVSESGGTSEYVGKAGYIFPPGDVEALKKSLLCVQEDSNLYSDMCDEARSRAEKMPTWSQVSQKFYEFATHIMSNQKSARV